MSDVTERGGHCLCGAIHITAKHASNKVGACHCSMCRRWCGGPLLEVDCGSDVIIDGEEHMTVFDSSEWAERAFCSKCGTNLFYRLKGTQQHQILVGLFDSSENLAFDLQVFTDEKPSFYSFAEKTDMMTGAEVIAKFGGGD